jgi:hypothetical protein
MVTLLESSEFARPDRQPFTTHLQQYFAYAALGAGQAGALINRAAS